MPLDSAVDQESQLKSSWCLLIGKTELPQDHYAVFKAATQYAAVPLVQIRASLGIGRRRFRRLRSIALNHVEFDKRIRSRGIIERNSKGIGIPQGLPISGLLANLVMFDVDHAMNLVTSRAGGTYRRYSDDILIMTPPGRAAECEAMLKDQLDRLGLRIQDAKTVRSRFSREGIGPLRASTSLQYLGLEFDGQKVLVRSGTLVKFGKRMARAVNRARNAARRATPKGQPIRLRRRDLYARFSHLLPHVETPVRNRPRSSFMRYGKRAHDVVVDAGDAARFASQIRMQLSGQWRVLQKLIRDAEKLTGVRKVEGS